MRRVLLFAIQTLLVVLSELDHEGVLNVDVVLDFLAHDQLHLHPSAMFLGPDKARLDYLQLLDPSDLLQAQRQQLFRLSSHVHPDVTQIPFAMSAEVQYSLSSYPLQNTLLAAQAAHTHVAPCQTSRKLHATHAALNTSIFYVLLNYLHKII